MSATTTRHSLLSDQEARMLSVFRRLDPSLQNVIITMAQIWVAEEGKARRRPRRSLKAKH